jgi:hypothetical protein
MIKLISKIIIFKIINKIYFHTLLALINKSFI